MFNIKMYNKISPCGTKLFDSNRYTCTEQAENPDGILVRSAKLHDETFGSNLLAIARAGAGVNNIPIDRCSENGIVVFNTPGANANAVKELVFSALFLSSRKISEGIEWTKTLAGKGDDIPSLVEKGKSNFAGPELEGKTLGVIGLGAIGVMVANTAYHLGMNVIGYDPYLSIDAAWGMSRAVKHCTNLEEIYRESDYITVHVPLNDETRGMLQATAFSAMKQGVRILNFARGELVDSDDMRAALESGKVACYVTDFPNAKTLAMPNTICIPHLGASTPESEDNCASAACSELIDYLENGNIRNSVNMPNLVLPKTSHKRLCVIHRNKPNILTGITGIVSACGINIENMTNKSKKDYAYTVLEVDADISKEALEKISEIADVLRVRII